jgi:hypothetical protein
MIRCYYAVMFTPTDLAIVFVIAAILIAPRLYENPPRPRTLMIVASAALVVWIIGTLLYYLSAMHR